MTKVKSKVGNGNYKCALGCIMGCCWAGCCLAALCFNSLKDHTHKCYNCDETLHKVKGGDKVRFYYGKRRRNRNIIRFG